MDLNNLTIPYILEHGQKIFTHAEGETIYRIVQEQASFCCQIIPLPDYTKQLGQKKAEQVLKHMKSNYQEHFEHAEKIKSPQIINYLKFMTIDKYACIFQQSFHMTLTQYMRKRNHEMPYPEKLKILEELFEGVKCLSEGKIIHRSLHPDNIVVCDNKNDRPTFKICGFMESFDLQQRTPTGNDTPNSVTDYTAPEIKLFKRHNEKADVWSLGAVLYWMLFGQIHGIMVNIEGQEQKHEVVVNCHENTPKWLCSFIGKMLSAHPDDRHNIHDALMILRQAIACADATSKIMDSIPLH